MLCRSYTSGRDPNTEEEDVRLPKFHRDRVEGKTGVLRIVSEAGQRTPAAAVCLEQVDVSARSFKLAPKAHCKHAQQSGS